jgi:23S rRNA (adenine-N6)-dimethyltransferase
VPAPARARWGWHRLADDWARRIVDGAEIAPGDLVVDIGAGTGALTSVLARAGARVIAVELHPTRVAYLRGRFEGAPVTVVRADVADLRLPRRPFKVVANPPFALTSQVLRRLLVPNTRLVSAHVVVQRAAARRWAAGRAPGAGRWMYEFDVRVARSIPRRAFSPPPPVDASVLALRRR